MPSGWMEITRRVHWHKGARLSDQQVEQGRKSVKVILRFRVEGPWLNGYKLPRG